MNLLRIGARKARTLAQRCQKKWCPSRVAGDAPRKRDAWSIAIYTGDSPFDLQPLQGIRNPVLSACDVSDVPADFVADPFMVRNGDQWHLFFEVLNGKSKLGQIAVAKSSDGHRWDYQRIVLDEPFHLSYPYVFPWDGEFYMIPETHQAGAVRLYKSVNFPCEWTFVKNLLEGVTLVDASPFFYEGRWWLFAGSGDVEKWHSQDLRLFYADDLMGPWLEHPQSPVVAGDSRIARPSGRVIVTDGKVFRLAQDCEGVYGRQVRAFEVTALTAERYEERPARGEPILKPADAGWNSTGMHHIDAHLMADGQWLACVDGWTWVDA